MPALKSATERRRSGGKTPFLTPEAIRAAKHARNRAVLAGIHLSGNLIRIWVQKFESGALTTKPSQTVEVYEARITALERLVGRQALEIEFLNGALKQGPRPRSATTSVITGPMAVKRRAKL